MAKANDHPRERFIHVLKGRFRVAIDGEERRAGRRGAAASGDRQRRLGPAGAAGDHEAVPRQVPVEGRLVPQPDSMTGAGDVAMVMNVGVAMAVSMSAPAVAVAARGVAMMVVMAMPLAMPMHTVVPMRSMVSMQPATSSVAAVGRRIARQEKDPQNAQSDDDSKTPHSSTLPGIFSICRERPEPSTPLSYSWTRPGSIISLPKKVPAPVERPTPHLFSTMRRARPFSAPDGKPARTLKIHELATSIVLPRNHTSVREEPGFMC